MKFSKQSIFPVLSLSLVLAASAQAAPVAISKEKLPAIVEAVSDEVHSLCLGSIANNIQDYRDYLETYRVDDQLQRVNSGMRDDSGAQPVLTLTYDDGSYAAADFSITTSSDYKTVAQVVVTEKRYQRVNHGTIPDPDMRVDLVVFRTFNCK